MEFKITREQSKQRLDKYLLSQIEDMTRSYLQTLIKQGNVTVNEKQQKNGYLLKENDIIMLDIPKKQQTTILPEKIDWDIMYEDEDIIIINKEKGMVVHPANGNYSGTMVNALMDSHKNKLSTINGIIRPGIVHRIDKDTSGILVVAKNDKAHKALSDQFKEHSITRKYIALVKGIIKEDNMDIDLPIGRSSKDRKKMAVTNKNAKRAVTHICVLRRYYHSNVTLVEVTLETGRTHQIRVHMAYHGHALVGDEIYGKKDTRWKVKGQMLHAKVLGFVHPSTRKYVEFESKLPNEFEQILKKLESKEENK